MPVPRKKTTQRKPRTTKTAAATPKAAAKPPVTRARRFRGPRLLLIIDNEPIRREALEEYHRLEEEINAAREQVEAFEAGDLPAYQRWQASVFGPLLTELRTALQAIEEKRAILMEIEEEMFWGGCSPAAAYRRVMNRRNSPQPEPGEKAHGRSGSFEEEDPFGEGPDEDEGDRMFGKSDLPPDFDIDEFDRMSAKKQKKFRDDYKMMSVMYQMMTGRAAPDLEELLEYERRKRGRGGSGASSRAEDGRAPQPEVDHPTNRLKELYRKLVRQLHPDSAKEQTARERELWHEVQEAYKARDLERLEAVAGRVEMGLSGGAVNLPLQILRRMMRDLQDALGGLKSRVSSVRKHPAWLFRSKTKQLSKLEVKHRRALTSELRRANETLSMLTTELEQLAALANRPSRRKGPPKGRSPKKRQPNFYDDLPF